MKYTFILLILLTTYSCSDKSKITANNDKNKQNGNPKTYLALGDSYTICEGMKTADRWPNMLTSNLNAQNENWSFPHIIAKTGWTTRNLLDAIHHTSIRENDWDMVSLLIGVNNQFQGLSFYNFQKEFNELLDLSILFCKDSTDVFVASIPDYSVTRYGKSNKKAIALELDKYNTYMEMRCRELGVKFVNITEISRELGNAALANDGLHPNAVQYEKWVEHILRKTAL